MEHIYKTKGVCARHIHVEVENEIVKSVKFDGGCSGNTQAVAKLVEGMSVEQATQKLRGIRCGLRPTSCPDQLTYALEEAIKKI